MVKETSNVISEKFESGFMAKGGDGFREEVLNVVFAELLGRRGVISVPETILEGLSGGRGRRLPDIVAAQYGGLRVIIEGRIAEGGSVRAGLDGDCRNRIEEGIASIVVGLLYPPDLRPSRPLDDLRTAMESAHMEAKVFTEGGEGSWASVGPGDVAELIRVAYEELASESVVENAVSELRNAIEGAIRELADSPATEARLREVLVVPKSD